MTATVSNSDDTPRADELVTFVVTGANAGAAGTCVPADCKSNGSGKVSFTYTGTNAGDDTINASITVDGSTQTATATKTWEDEPVGTEGPFGNPTCSDGIDNDGDGQTDAADSDCKPAPPTGDVLRAGRHDHRQRRRQRHAGRRRDRDRQRRGHRQRRRRQRSHLHRGKGDDFVRGGTGNDTLYTEGGNDNVGGNAGNDLVRGGAGDDPVAGRRRR